MSLKLRAEDAEDLQVVSAHLQDALLRVGDIAWLPKRRRLALVLNRFCWEAQPVKVAGRDAYRRVSAGLHFDDVRAIKARGIDLSNAEGLLYLLAIRSALEADGAGKVELQFAGNAALQLEVECVSAALTDLGEPWLTEALPEHERESAGQ